MTSSTKNGQSSPTPKKKTGYLPIEQVTCFSNGCTIRTPQAVKIPKAMRQNKNANLFVSIMVLRTSADWRLQRKTRSYVPLSDLEFDLVVNFLDISSLNNITRTFPDWEDTASDRKISTIFNCTLNDLMLDWAAYVLEQERQK